MAIIYGTGFEMGTVPVPTFQQNRASISGTNKTGNYSLFMSSSTGLPKGNVNIDISSHSLNEVYISGWFRPTVGNGTRCYFYLTDGTYVGLRHDGVNWDAYRNGSLIGSGSIGRSVNTWVHIQMYLKIDNTLGRLVTKIDGIVDIDFTGDTQPNTSTTVSYLLLGTTVSNVSGYDIYIDDLTIDDSNWIGDVRYVGLLPDADTATINWTPSTGATNYNLLDEVPASDSDYVYTSTTGLQDLYTLGDWSSSGLTADVVIQWVRSRKETADTQQLKMLTYSGTTLTISSAIDLPTSEYYYFNQIFETDPDTGLAWTDAGIDALQVGIESVI